MAQNDGNQVPPAGPDEIDWQALVPESNWLLFRQLPNFDMRNGDISDITTVFMKASIPESRKWVPVGDLDPADGISAMDAFIKSHLELVEQNRGAELSVAQARKVGIVLGVARAVMTSFYRVTTAELIPGETLEPMLAVHQEEDGTMRYRVVETTVAGRRERLMTALELTEQERSAICALVNCSMGILAMQGYSLIMTGHHYLSQADSQARKIYMVVEKAYWRSPDVQAWFNEDLAVIQDALWHKAGHPVQMRIKETLAMDPTVASRLKAAGVGACASRLPAAESEIRSANSYQTLMATVAPMFEMFGGAVDMAALTNLTELVKSMPHNVAAPPLPSDVREIYGGTVTNRESGLRALEAMLKRNQDRVAYAYGFYMAQAEHIAAMGSAAAAAEDTLRTSYSLKKLKSQSFASYHAGYNAFGDYQAVRNKRRADGIFDAPAITIV